MYNIVLLGPQGCGKGTQSEIIAEKLGLPAVSVGRLFRAEMERHTGLGREISAIIEHGELVPSDITRQIVLDRLEEEDARAGIVIDGYPRSADQAKHLDDIFKLLDRKITDVIFMGISDEIAIKRLAGRLVCSNPRCERGYHTEFNPPIKEANACDICNSPLVKRSDDNEAAIRRRLEIFHQEAAPIVDYYTRQNILHSINGDQTIPAVTADIMRALGAVN